VTTCYRRIDGRWWVVHEHVSSPYDPTTGQMVPIHGAGASAQVCVTLRETHSEDEPRRPPRAGQEAEG
jgi:hypothetical protein